MNNLPVEIAKKIFTSLHQQDKVQCMSVCQRWADIIENCCLFQTIHIASKTSMETLVKIFREKPQQGAQVEYLIINLYIHESLNLNDLTLFLPNLRLFYVNAPHTVFSKTPASIQPWSQRIEHVFLYDNPSLANTIFNSNSCCQLKRLTIDGESLTTPGFFQNISNLVHLTELLVNDFELTLDSLESLHTNLPYLKSLTFDQSQLKYDPLLFNISPVTSISKFHFINEAESTSTVETQAIWFRYIARKYPNLSDLKFFNTCQEEEDSDEDDEMLNIPDASTQFGEFFRNIGVGLKELHLKSNILPLNLFELLDDANCQVQHLSLSSTLVDSIIKNVTRSNQNRSIQVLELDCVSSEDMQWARGMLALKTLSMQYEDGFGVAGLNNILEMCPNTLESLELKDVKLAIDPSSLTRPFPIKHLTFNHVGLPEQFDAFFSVYLPLLRGLKIIYCTIPNPNISLPNHHLSHFEVLDSTFGRKTMLLVATSKDNRRALYRTRCHNGRSISIQEEVSGIIPFEAHSRCTIYNPATDDPTLLLECASVNSVVVF